MKHWAASILGLLAYIAFPSVDGGGQAIAAPVAIGSVLELIDWAVWTRTYEGYALADRALGRALYTRDDLAELARAFESPRYRQQLPELEDRLVRMENAYRAGEATWSSLARRELSQAPLRASAQVEFIPASETGFETVRDAFLLGPSPQARGEIMRDVQLFVRSGYAPFQADLLARAESLGMVVQGNYRQATVLVGRAPSRAVKALSGIDGIDRLRVLERSARPNLGQPAMAPQDYIRGVNARST